MASQARDNEEKKTQERKKALLVLICRHLCDHGYVETAERLQSEGGAHGNVNIHASVYMYARLPRPLRFERAQL